MPRKSLMRKGTERHIDRSWTDVAREYVWFIRPKERQFDFSNGWHQDAHRWGHYRGFDNGKVMVIS